MKTFRLLFFVSALFAVLNAGAAPGVELKGGETPEQIQEAYTKAIEALLPGLGKNDGQALKNFEATLHHAARPEAEPERLACCKAIASALNANTPTNAMLWMMKLAAFAGKVEVVPALSNILASKDTLAREYARCALQQNPAPEAAAALRQTLLGVWHRGEEPLWQAALALALAARKDYPTLDGFITLVQQKDQTVMEAGLAGLGELSTQQSIRARPGIWKGMPPKLQVASAESYMKNAERLLREGKTNEAAQIYTELNTPESPRPIRLAAVCGFLTAQGDDAAAKILENLAGTDVDARAISLGVMPDLGSGALKLLAAGLAKLPVESQGLVLATLAERGEKSALPVALDFAKSKDEKMRLAGLAALGGLGDAFTVPVLVEALPASQARESLVRLSGPQVEENIIAAMRRQDELATRAALIEVLEIRNAAGAVPALLQESVHDSSSVRRAAMRALGKMAQPSDLPAMTKGLLKSSPGSERDGAEKAIATVCARSANPGQQADAVLAMYESASPADRLALLPALGRLGGKKVFDAIKSALASADAETAQAALNAMANWPESDDAAENELLTLAQKGAKNSDRAAALRAYIRLISTPSGLPETVRLGKFQKAMELAESDAEKNLVLERIAEIKRIEALRFISPCLDKPALAQKACSATLDLARDRALRGRHKAEFDEALNKVLAVCKDQGLRDRANRYLQEK